MAASAGASLPPAASGGEELAEMNAPPWILESQRFGWTGWEATAVPSDEPLVATWLLDAVGFAQDPSPFEAFDEAGEDGPPSAKMDRNAFSRGAGVDRALETAELLRHLAYRPGAARHRWTYCVRAEETTDAAGWLYASSASRIVEQRLGGRAGQRYGDKFRQRWWRRQAADARGESSEPHSVVDFLKAPAEPSASSSSRRGSAQLHHPPAEEDSIWSVITGAAEAAQHVLGSRSFWRMPMDPTAALRRSNKLSAAYQDMCKRLPEWDDIETLGRLCVAAVYMRAVYGYTARSNNFDFLSRGAVTFSIGKAAFDLTKDVCDASNTLAFLDMVNLRREDLLKVAWRPAGKFDPCYVVLRDREMRWLLVCIRGTLSNKDILTDVAVKTVPFLEGEAHEGMVTMTRRLLDEVKTLIKAELSAQPDYRLVFAGHSMGGAVAALAAALCRHEYSERESWGKECVAYTVGTPGILSRCVGERLQREGIVFTAVNNQDWSPRVSTSNAEELLDDLCELSTINTLSKAVDEVMGQRQGNEADDALNEDCPLAAVREQLVPGAILQIDGVAGAGQAVKILAARPADYRNCTPVWLDVEAHLPIHYLRGLLQGLCAAVLASRRKGRPLPASVLATLRRIAEPPTAAAAAFPPTPSGYGNSSTAFTSFASYQQGPPLPKEPDGAREIVARSIEQLALPFIE
eukprot:TRINITY_DN19567_c0_g1_i1.p1 TRINITY_DN19567_c0_g1~~TRINITY_DN19567_c0_g1_i1.p1  ORF type:complete len:729 (-),score=131.81 TRINITY_DN19567_c0_g1_i1:217-2286(-)